MPSWTPGSGTRPPADASRPAGPSTAARAEPPAIIARDGVPRGALPPAGDGAPPRRGAAARSIGPRSAAGRAARAIARFARRKPLGALGGVIVAGMLLMAAFAHELASYGYEETIRGARFRPPGSAHWLGTDNLGRDLWSRIVYGARVSVTVGFATIALGTLLATAIGVSSGYLGGAYDLTVQRLVDAWMSFPYLVIVLSVMAVLGPGLVNVILSLAVITAAASSRVIRGATIAVAGQPYVEAALAVGAGHLRVILRHVLPNVVPTILILATIGLGGVILAESALSFLGFGVPPPYPSWGGMLSGSGRTHMLRAPWMAIWPGVAISLAVFGFNMLGDALRDVLDPRLRGR
jgi:peptide/nickel transport system permease protein